MVDTWVGLPEAAERLRMTRQTLHRRARRLVEVGLARQNPSTERWEIASDAIEQYASTGSWPRVAAAATTGDAAAGIDELRVDLAVAGERAALLAEKDEAIRSRDERVRALLEEVASLKRELAAVRGEYAAVLAARAASLAGGS